MNIVLIGMRGAGKSNLSRRLALLTKRSVLSTDTLVQYECEGKSIPEILADNQGDWGRFRDLEYRVVEKLHRLDNQIIDCGGGIVVDLDEQGNEVYSERKMSLLKKNGLVVWLDGDIDRLARKIAGDSNRPALDQVKGHAEMMRRRLPFYRKAADLVLPIEGVKRNNLVKKLYRKLCKRGLAG